jgi:signal transduction histidine kinase/Skp family chaperone for outer membrane proteins
MMKTQGASLAEFSPTAPQTRIELTNPATRFRKLFPYVGTALVVIIAAAGYATMKGMATSRDWLGHTYQVKSELADVELNRALLHEYQTEALPSAEKQAGLQSAAEALRQSLQRLKEATQDNAAEQERIEQLEPLLERHVQQLQSATSATPAEKPEEGRNSGAHAGAAPAENNSEEDASISRIIADIDTRESQLLGVREATWDREFQRNIAVLAFAVGACLLLLFTNMHLLREDVRSSRVATEHIRDSADSYRALSARIIGLQDAERRRIGRELHDSVGQILGALQMNLEQVEATPGSPSSALLAESRELLQRTAKDVRTISQLLHPPLLDVVGFVAAARNYVQEFARRSGIQAKANFPDDLKLPSKEAELMLFRVLQESLTNVHRHAQATSVDAWLARHDRELALTIQDNGRGLPAGVIENFEAGMASGVGLAGMRERLAEFGGKLHVESSPSGTIVRASMPV